jgi:hypothetical protein
MMEECVLFVFKDCIKASPTHLAGLEIGEGLEALVAEGLI